MEDSGTHHKIGNVLEIFPYERKREVSIFKGTCLQTLSRTLLLIAQRRRSDKSMKRTVSLTSEIRFN